MLSAPQWWQRRLVSADGSGETCSSQRLQGASQPQSWHIAHRRKTAPVEKQQALLAGVDAPLLDFATSPAVTGCHAP